jgi:hypothetical protein
MGMGPRQNHDLPTTPASDSPTTPASGGPTTPASGSTLGKAYSLVAILVGVVLVATAISIATFQIDLPVSLLLTYCGVAALFSGLGATAAVSLNLKPAGQAGSATGAAR